MKKSPLILRCAAILLILVFSQKSGTGLFIHDLFHTSKDLTEIPENKSDSGKGISYACSCIDDFLMPFSGAEESIIALPISYSSILVTVLAEPVIFRSSLYSSLRGPPADLL